MRQRRRDFSKRDVYLFRKGFRGALSPSEEEEALKKFHDPDCDGFESAKPVVQNNKIKGSKLTRLVRENALPYSVF